MLVQCTRFQGMQRGAVASPVNMRYVSSGNQRNFSTGGSVEDKITVHRICKADKIFTTTLDRHVSCRYLMHVILFETVDLEPRVCSYLR